MAKAPPITPVATTDRVSVYENLLGTHLAATTVVIPALAGRLPDGTR
jgi:hypothetical protein